MKAAFRPVSLHFLCDIPNTSCPSGHWYSLIPQNSPIFCLCSICQSHGSSQPFWIHIHSGLPSHRIPLQLPFHLEWVLQGHRSSSLPFPSTQSTHRWITDESLSRFIMGRTDTVDNYKGEKKGIARSWSFWAGLRRDQTPLLWQFLLAHPCDIVAFSTFWIDKNTRNRPQPSPHHGKSHTSVSLCYQ